MTDYMKTAQMPWPALRFDARMVLSQYLGNSIPWLVIVDESGRPVTQNGVDKVYIAPAQILAKLENELLR